MDHTIIVGGTAYEKIGEGSYGAVYKDRSADRVVKVIRLNDPEGCREVFIKEMLGAHANIIPHTKITVDYVTGSLYIHMPYYSNTLYSYMAAAHKTMAFDTRVNIISDILTGVQYMHSKGIAHLDIKPNNIMIDSRDKCRFIDFGLARVITDSRTISVSQTYLFGCPEADNIYAATSQADMWSVGCVLFYVLTGAHFVDPVKYENGGAERKRIGEYKYAAMVGFDIMSEAIYDTFARTASEVEIQKRILEKIYKSGCNASFLDSDIGKLIVIIIAKCFAFDTEKRITSSQALIKLVTFKYKHNPGFATERVKIITNDMTEKIYKINNCARASIKDLFTGEFKYQNPVVGYFYNLFYKSYKDNGRITDKHKTLAQELDNVDVKIALAIRAAYLIIDNRAIEKIMELHNPIFKALSREKLEVKERVFVNMVSNYVNKAIEMLDNVEIIS